MHFDGPSRLNHHFPGLRKDNISVWVYEIIMALINVWTNNLHMQEGLFDQFLHSLQIIS